MKTKSFLSFGFIFLLFLLLGIYQHFNTNTQIEQVQKIKEKTLQSAILSSDLKLNVVQVQQYFSDISATRAQNGLDDGFELAQQQSEQFYNTLQRLKDLNPNENERLQVIEQSFTDYYEAGQKMAQAYIEGGPEKGNPFMPEFDQYATTINDKVDAFQQEKVTAIEQSLANIENLITKNTSVFNWAGIIIFIVGILIATLMSRSIIVPLQKLMTWTEAIAEGDLQHVADVDTKGEFGKLARSFDRMRLQLGGLIQQIETTSQEIGASTEKLNANAERNEQATEQITIAMQNVATSVERQAQDASNSTLYISEVSQAMQQAATAIQKATDLSDEAKSQAHDGNTVVQETVNQMQLIHQKVEATFEVIQRLDQKSQEINQIIAIITEISEQTNLLALNAAIESARAGEHGKGFAVVADEVRKLAEQSGESANQIKHLIHEIQEEADNAITSMNDGIAAVQDGMTFSTQTGDSFNKIQQMIDQISSQNEEISAVVEEVNASTENIVGTMKNMSQSSEEAAMNAQEVAAAADDQYESVREISTAIDSLRNMSQNLTTLLQQFQPLSTKHTDATNDNA